jgi:dual specificity protein phosphatase-like protein
MFPRHRVRAFGSTPKLRSTDSTRALGSIPKVQRLGFHPQRCGQDSSRGAASAPRRTVPDFDFVTSRLATGAALSAPDDVYAIVEAGITHVLDARSEFDDGPLFASQPHIHYLWNPTDDDGTTKLPEYFEKTIAFGLRALVEPGTRVLCHCAAGVNRGPSNVLAIMIAWGIDPVKAEAMIRDARPVVKLHYRDDVLAAVRALGYVRSRAPGGP